MNGGSQRRANRRARLALYAVHGLLAAFFLLPLVFMFVSAFKTDEAQLLRDMNSLAAFAPVGELGLGNFTEVMRNTPFVRAFVNSLLVVAVTVVLGILVNSMLAYALARLRFTGRKLLLAVVIALIIVPFEAIAVPLLLLVNELPWFGGQRGWLDSFHVQVIPFIGHAFAWLRR